MIVFVDVSTPDWIADPLGWVLILIALAALRDRLPDYGQVSLAGWTSVFQCELRCCPRLSAAIGWPMALRECRPRPSRS